MNKQKYEELCEARNKLCDFCEVYECEQCIVAQLIDDASDELEEESDNEGSVPW